MRNLCELGTAQMFVRGSTNSQGKSIIRCDWCFCNRILHIYLCEQIILNYELCHGFYLKAKK